MAKVSFASEKPSICVKLCGEDVRFQNGVLTLDEDVPAENAMMQELRLKLQHPDFVGMRQLIRELDTSRAEEIARRHMQSETAKHRVGHGGLNSMSQDLQAAATGATQAALEDTMRSNGATDEQIAEASEELRKDGLLLTESTAGLPPFRQPREGFVPSANGASAGTGEHEAGAGTQTTRVVLPPNTVIPRKPLLPPKPPGQA